MAVLTLKLIKMEDLNSQDYTTILLALEYYVERKDLIRPSSINETIDKIKDRLLYSLMEKQIKESNKI